MLRFLRVLLAGLVLVSPAACTGFEGLAREKTASLNLWAVDTVETPRGPVPIRRYVSERSAFIAEGVDGIDPFQDAQGHRRVRLLLGGRPAEDAAGGVAVAVDADGYWLTAAHCVERAPVLLLPSGGSPDEPVQGYACRVVWSGHGDLAGDDLALVHAPGSVRHGVMALSATPPAAGVVLSCGSGIGSPSWSAGRISSVGGAVDGSVAWFEHSTPLGPGDSGGPAILPDGTLGGINVRGEGRPGNDRSTAAWISPAVLRRMIDQDKERRSGAAAPGGE